MKFVCEYRTKDNVLCSLAVSASSRDAAYSLLKSQGIKPARLYDAPGFFNKLLGRGKRWILICALLCFSVCVCSLFFSLKFRVESQSLYEDRGQLYGDPVLLSSLIRENWVSVFPDVGDQFLASFAIPCKIVDVEWPMPEVLSSLKKNMKRRNRVLQIEHREVAQMKRMVNQMRRELEEYVSDGGSVEKYLKRLEARQAVEFEIYQQARKELVGELDESVWRAKNDFLRSKGLPMVAPDL